MQLLGIYFCLLLPVAVLGKDYFTAAVFEHRPRTLNTSQAPPEEIISTNLKYYEKAVPLAAKKGVDILVFNEYGLFLHVTDRDRLKQFMENIPDPKKQVINPCRDRNYNTLILSTISCMARQYNIYIQVNMGDIHPCLDTCDADGIDECRKGCPKDGVLIYNTNVVFDREGNIVARYHKGHPFFEYVNAPEEFEFVTFKTEFGTFGLLTCFDIIFKESALLAKDHGIDTLLFSTYWYDDIGPLNSVEFQQSFALENKINVLAANTQKSGTASLGSGIYSKDSGALVYSYDNDGESKLLIANVRIKEGAEVPALKLVYVITEENVHEKEIETGQNFPEHSLVRKVGKPKNEYTDYRYYKSHLERHTVNKLQGPSGEIETCNGDFCCSLKYSAEDMQEDFYLTAFSGLNEVRNHFRWGEETCLLVRCDPFDGKPCVLLASTSKTVFKNLELKAYFKSQWVYATVTKNKFRLAPTSEWSYVKKDSVTTLKFETQSNEPLLKAGLFGRNYDSDPIFIPYTRP